jgi:hypothetical protein
MSEIERLQGWVDDGTLLHPLGAANTVDLSAALGRLCGVEDARRTENSERLVEAVGAAEHYLLVLVDGLGMHILDSLPTSSFFRSHLATELRAVFPSSTAPALTSLATGKWPAEHAVPAWFTYLPEAGLTSAILPHVDRATRRPLARLGVDSGAVLFEPSAYSRFDRPVEWFVPAPIADSVYTRYAAGSAGVQGHPSLEEAITRVARRVQLAGSPTFTYLYHPDVDAAQHNYGALSEEALAEAARADALLGAMARALAGRARLLVTADHGQITPPENARHFLRDGDPLEALLRVWPPAGEPRVPFFHVRHGRRLEFESAFSDRFSEGFALLPTEEAAQLGLFGPVPLGKQARARLGDYIAIPSGMDVVIYEPEEGIARMRGFHGGLAPAEVRVPLVLA